MATDDDEREPAPDPWDEIVAEGLGDDSGAGSFQFDEPAEPAAVGPEASGQADAAAPGADDAADALVDDWLSGGEDPDPAPPLAVFPQEEAAAGSSAIDIGTGASGIALHGPADQQEIGDESGAGVADGADGEAGWPGIDTTAAEAGGGFPDVTPGPAVVAGAAAGAAAGTSTRRPARPARKPSAIGQMIGVVLGGVMAIPITLAILIYGLGKDPFGVTKKLPAEVAFLLPEKFRPGFKKPAARVDEPGASALDDLPTATEPAPVPAVAGGEPVPAEPADMPVEPEPVPEPQPDALAFEPPGLDDLGAKPEPAPPAEPPPLDTAALDAAVGEAAALAEALTAVDDRGNRAYKLLRTRWYRAVARVAEELVALEDAAATSGRPLPGAPDSVAALHGTIGGRESLASELAALAPDWLAYAKRGGDGVVLPVTFESARKVGPYWTARMTLTGADGQPRDLTVISRSEPAAIAGDRVVVTGVALDGTVIWAADVRPAGAGGFSAGF